MTKYTQFLGITDRCKENNNSEEFVCGLWGEGNS